MAVDMRENALALLRAMNETAKGRTDVVVGPDGATVALSGVEYEHEDRAMEWLLDEGAIIPDEEMQARSRRLVGQPTYGMFFYITERGLELLR